MEGHASPSFCSLYRFWIWQAGVLSTPPRPPEIALILARDFSWVPSWKRTFVARHANVLPEPQMRCCVLKVGVFFLFSLCRGRESWLGVGGWWWRVVVGVLGRRGPVWGWTRLCVFGFGLVRVCGGGFGLFSRVVIMCVGWGRAGGLGPGADESNANTTERRKRPVSKQNSQGKGLR